MKYNYRVKIAGLVTALASVLAVTVMFTPNRVQASTCKATYIGEYECTAYCTEKRKHICGTGTGLTSSGEPVVAGVSVAVGDLENLPYGTTIYIEGVGLRVVQDTGSWVKKDQIDVACGTHEEALHWDGQGKHKVCVIEWEE